MYYNIILISLLLFQILSYVISSHSTFKTSLNKMDSTITQETFFEGLAGRREVKDGF